MKRLLTVSLTLLLMFAMTTLAGAAQGGAGQRGSGRGAGPNFVDADGDGICDHFQAGGRGAGRMGTGGVCAWCGLGAKGGSLVDIAATTLGRNRVDVVAELRAGKTLAQVMEANGRTSQDLVDAVMADRKAVLDRSVANGTLNAQQADGMLARIKTHVEQMVSGGWQPAGQGSNCPGCGYHGRHHGRGW